jgi:hypothetical protein
MRKPDWQPAFSSDGLMRLDGICCTAARFLELNFFLLDKIRFLSFSSSRFEQIWYLDLWQNHDKLVRDQEIFIRGKGTLDC